MTTSRDDDSGKFTEQYPRSAFVEAVANIENATTTKVAEEVGCSYDLAYRRLNALESENEIERITVGSSFIWIPK
ncbi:transcriptional regulator [Haloarcula marina]|uniref:transcriptional regulator n=1 Tax=Haloarcula marina TaxID=2961574 RepID=UPI0020B6B735|nr:transcriptional regulator [Halomicroarcula marina]